MTVPSSATSMFASCGRFGFASFTAFLTASFSSGVKLDGSFTSTGVVGAFIAGLTVLFAGIVPISLPSLSFTVTLPSSATSIVASAGNFGFAFLTASSTAFFSSGVNLDGSATSIGLAGAFNSAPGVAFSSTKSLPLIVSCDPSG